MQVQKSFQRHNWKSNETDLNSFALRHLQVEFSIPQLTKITTYLKTSCQQNTISNSRLCLQVHNSAVPPGKSRSMMHYVTDSKPVSVYGSLCENGTSSTKLEVHNALQYHQKTTEPQSQVTCTENIVKLVRGFWDMWANRETHRLTDRHRHANHNTLHSPRREGTRTHCTQNDSQMTDVKSCK